MEDPIPPNPEDESSNHVEVPETVQPVDENAWLELERTIDPNRQSEYHGVDIYCEVLQFMMERLPRPTNN